MVCGEILEIQEKVGEGAETVIYKTHGGVDLEKSFENKVVSSTASHGVRVLIRGMTNLGMKSEEIIVPKSGRPVISKNLYIPNPDFSLKAPAPFQRNPQRKKGKGQKDRR